ncbi:MAG: Asp23/Gls24 family envelope stress response protein [Liquorilactobacillus hordei]|uniref:Asp23/Gls24 family envelope stress response protein n=1 Tax=Liquorilactobacillus hordei TaxID=468911 RepID=UPI001CBD9CED|nr:Asp23/Gls24 family envelope stress response protein [Liquorilactobacillus hordei]MBZ2404805.1 Asp23/Gls24 family envelope stress response protein [Liquorilactobacillus hordei]
MAENNNIVIESKEATLGQIEIAPEVIEVIIGIAASQVDGVYSMRGSLANSVNELFGRKSRGKGVKLGQSMETLTVEIYVFLNYGVSVPKVASEIQEKVKQQLLFMTGLELATVDVYVQGVVPEKQVSTVDPNNLFDEENGGEK